MGEEKARLTAEYTAGKLPAPLTPLLLSLATLLAAAEAAPNVGALELDMAQTIAGKGRS